MALAPRAAIHAAKTCGLHARVLPGRPDPEALSEVFASLPCACILGGNPTRPRHDRFSYWAADPIDRIEIRPDDLQALDRLDKALNGYLLAYRPAGLPKGMFCGGWMGFMAYDLARSIEQLRRPMHDDLGMPAIALGLYDRLVAYDHLTDRTWLVALELADGEPVGKKIDGLYGLLQRASSLRPGLHAHPEGSQVRSNMSRSYYLDAVAQIKRHILDGDVYQVNLSQRFMVGFKGRPIDLFIWQGRFNPSPYAAYLDWPPYRIVCASPELFLRIVDDIIETRPIKGTRPRFTDTQQAAQQEDQEGFVELITSQKERAELAMIVDLQRNDLARICIPGTRYVPVERMIQAYATLYHAVAVIRGRLAPGTRFAEILRATFPGGSVTGAPKIMAMQIIAGLEPTARGLYTGAIGYVGLDGTASLNMAIRTAIILDRMAFVQVGGGIVADSDPQAEYEETLTKAKALLTGLGGI